MADVSSDYNSVQNEIIVSELLCYLQNKIENLPHDVLLKIVVDFYSKEDIHFTKTLLFDKCKETAIRLKKYNVDWARLDCRDIINKLNEVGVDCPIFVAQIAHLLSCFFLNQLEIQRVHQCKYLGIMICIKNSDIDLNRHLKKLYVNINIIFQLRSLISVLQM